ncbi:MAG: tetratricopeptide repeat protein, partial [Dehalococcoidia bacterium]|nr:tetratricopeptide repeat protein [Dehalococcoidia bacterium]
GIAIFGLLTGLGVALYQAKVARTHAARAERRFGEVRKLARSILLEHYELIRELPGATKAKESMAKVSQEYLNSLAAEADDPVLILELANAYRRLAEVQGAPGEQNLGQTVLATENFRKAIGLLDRLPAGEWNNPKVLDSAVASMRRLARLLQHEGKLEEAAKLVERQVKLARELYARVPDNPNVAVQYVTVHRELAILALRRDDVAAAVKYGEEALQVASSVVAANPHPIVQAERVNIYPVYADALWKQGDLPRVERLYEDFLASMGQLSARNPDNRYFAGLKQFGHFSLGRLHSSFLRLNLGNADKAERNCRIYLDWYQRALRADPANARAGENVIHGSLCLGTAVAMRRPLAALPYLEDAVRRAYDEVKRENTLRTREILAYTLLVLAQVQSEARKNTDARLNFEHALAIYDAMENEGRSSGEGTDAMLANRQYARLTRDAGRARKAVGMALSDGLPQSIVHAAEAREVLADVSPADRCTALREAADLWTKARAHAFTAALAGKRLQELPLGGCAKP